MGATSRDLRVGSVLAGRYRLTDLLGEGGMGAVYAAFDESLRRDVAIKLVRTDRQDDATATARFVREARAAAALTHPNVITVHDVGVDGDVVYQVLEKLSGESLQSRIERRGSLDVASVAALADRLLDALEFAHRAGIVHRDIKPANIFLCAPGDTPKLLDFGIASMALEPNDPKLTSEGAGLGTPLYVAPEQLRGLHADPRADVYSLAAVLYQALSGRPPHLAGTIPELYALKLEKTPAPLASVTANVPPALAATIDRALSREPAMRPASAAAFRQEIDASVARTSTPRASGPVIDVSLEATQMASGEAAMARTTAPVVSESVRTMPAQRGDSRRRGIAALGLVVLAAAGGGTWFVHSRRAAPLVQPTLGLRQIALYHDAHGEARAVLAGVEPWRAAADDFARVMNQRGAPPRWRAAEAFCNARASLEQGDIPNAISGFRRAISLDANWSPAHVGLASALSRSGERRAALEEARTGARLDPGWWLPVAMSGGVLSEMGDYWGAIGAFRRAVAIAPDEPALLSSLALALHSAGVDEEAATTAQRALAVDPDLVSPRVVLAERALEHGDGATALRESERAVSVAPQTAPAHLLRADALAMLGRDAEALDAYRHLIDLLDRTHQVGIPDERVAAIREAIARGALPAGHARRN